MDQFRQEIVLDFQRYGDGVVEQSQAVVRNFMETMRDLTRELNSGNISIKQWVEGTSAATRAASPYTKVLNDLAAAHKKQAHDVIQANKEIEQAERDLASLRKSLRDKDTADARAAHDEKVRQWEEQQARLKQQAAIETNSYTASDRLREAKAALAAAIEKYGNESWEASRAAAELLRAEQNITRESGRAATGLKTTGQHAQEMANKVSHGTRGVYFLSQGLQDLNYGVLAVANNIPIIVEQFAMAGGAGYESAMKFAAGVAIVTAGLHTLAMFGPKVADAIRTANIDAATARLDDLKKKLDSINTFSWIVKVDQAEVDKIERRIWVLEQRASAAEAMMNKATSAEEEAGRRASHLVGEFGGGEGNIKTGYQIIEDTFVENDPRVVAAKKLLAEESRRFMESNGDSEASFRYAQDMMNETLVKSRDEAKQLIGSVGKGEEAGTQRFVGLAQANRAALEQAGVDPRFFANLDQLGARRARADLDANRGPRWEEEEKRRKEDEAARGQANSRAWQEFSDSLKEKERAAERRRNDAFRDVKAEQVLSGPALAGQFVPPNAARTAETVAEMIGGDLKENRVQAQRDRQAEREREAADAKAARELDRRINAESSRIGGAAADDARLGVARRMAAGESDAEIMAALAPRIEGIARQSNVPADIVDAVAERVAAKIIGGVRASGAAAPGGFAGQAADMQQDFNESMLSALRDQQQLNEANVRFYQPQLLDQLRRAQQAQRDAATLRMNARMNRGHHFVTPGWSF